tara:strand:- start:471 stop:704 length:234 start_codon:yes stop_codon:yes gene_type:complete
MSSQYTFDLEVESWELRVVVTVSGGNVSASMEEPAECPEVEWYIEKVLSIGSFDDINDDDILNAVCNELDELSEIDV